MLNRRRSQIAVGLALLAITGVGAVLAGSREVIRANQRHVVTEISNVDGIVQISVNCKQAAVVTTGESRELDLGFMPVDDLIFISTISDDLHPAWGFRIRGNGRVFFSEKQGHVRTPLGPTAEEDAVVFARAFTAGGHELGSIGCQKPGLISKSDVPEYLQAPDDENAPEVYAEESPFQPRHFPYDQIDALGRWSLPLLAVLGAIAAIATPPIRRLAWSHKSALATGALAILSVGFVISSLPTILTLAGTALLFAVASLLVLGEPRVRRWLRRLD